MSYSFDTSAFVNGWWKRFPQDVFPTFWQRLDELVSAGRVWAVDEVLRELQQQDDAVLGWVKARRAMLVSLDEVLLMRGAAIANAYRDLVDSGSKMRGSADPFVIGLAVERQLTVVMDEAPSRKKRRKRIPDVCRELQVPCIDLLELCRREKWVF